MTGGAKSGEPEPSLADGDVAARQRLLAILDTCPIAAGVSNLDDGTIVYANNRLRDISRVDNGRDEGKSATDYWADAADRAAFVDAFQQTGHVSREVRMKRHDGSPYWALVQWESDPLFPGQVIFWVQDISALKRAQDNLRDANAEITRHRDHLSELVAERTRELRTIADNLPVLIVRIDVHERFTFTNATAAIWYDRPAGTIIGRSLQDTVGDAAYRLLQPRIARALSGRHASFEETILFPDGVERVVDVTLVPEIGSEKRVTGVFSLIVDISQRKRVELALRDSEKRFRDYTDASSDWHWETDERHVFTYVSANFETLTGIPLSEALGKTRQELSVESRETAEWREHEAAMMRHQPFRDFRSVRRNGDGRVLWVSVSGIPRFDAVGRFIGYRGTGREITALVEAEQALHESAERLNQAQKMQAVGQLTGGVAHDFNNLLAVILGNAELLVLGEGDAAELAEPILRAAERGGELTQRLLAFSRRQPLLPKVIDLERLVSGVSDMLARTLGETIQVDIRLEADLWQVLADPGQVESALLNLAINARDAMPDGGGLEIAVANSPLDRQVDAEGQAVVPGDYVSIQVSDQGSGMPPEILAHAFEPFFTTKEVGKGSGLGLSMVYGFAKQSGGLVTIDSTVGEGTTVTLFLPRATDTAQASEWLGARDAPRGQGERILVVEDEEEVRKLTVTLLEGLGYQVVDFADARGARAALASGVKVDLILADVVLPGGISGVDFVYQVGLEQPGIKVIFMSGYAAESGRISPLLESGYAFLGKPFQRRQLAELVRDTLDGPQLPVGAADPN